MSVVPGADSRSLEEGNLGPTNRGPPQISFQQRFWSADLAPNVDEALEASDEHNVVRVTMYHDPSMTSLCGWGGEIEVSVHPQLHQGVESIPSSCSNIDSAQAIDPSPRNTPSQAGTQRSTEAAQLASPKVADIIRRNSTTDGNGVHRKSSIETSKFTQNIESDSTSVVVSRASVPGETRVSIHCAEQPCNSTSRRPCQSQPTSPVAHRQAQCRAPHEFAHSGPLSQAHMNSTLESSPCTFLSNPNEFPGQQRGRSCDNLIASTETSTQPEGPRTRKGNYGLFRTRSTSGSRGNSLTNVEQDGRAGNAQNGEIQLFEEEKTPKNVSAGLYFDALKGPELETPRESEDLLLPREELWPFLLRFPIGAFRIGLGLGCQSVLWRDLSGVDSMSALHIPHTIHVGIWWVALATLVVNSAIYLAKCAVYFEAVRREFHHPVRINYFFTPWITGMFLAQTFSLGDGVVSSTVLAVLIVPIVVLELKIYGQWFSGGERRLSKIANPSTHLAVVGNFVAAKLSSYVGFAEIAVLLWAIGFAHYLVLFVTLYQRLPSSNVTLARELHPIYFLFVAVPSSASVSWKYISGSFGNVSKIFFFISLFIYALLGVRLNFFRGARFSVAWWAYSFPMTAAAIASIHYSQQVPSYISKGIAIFLSVVASVTVLILFCLTFLHAVVWRSLFPNDMAIAIATTKHHGKLVIRKKNSSPTRHYPGLLTSGDDKFRTAPDFTVEVLQSKTPSHNLTKLFSIKSGNVATMMDR